MNTRRATVRPSERNMQVMIANHFNRLRYNAIPNVDFSYLQCIKLGFDYSEIPFRGNNHEADLILLNDFINEVEIKISFSDFKRDFEKRERNTHITKYTKCFYYAFPQELFISKGNEITELVDRNCPYAGIMIVNIGHFYFSNDVRVCRRPKPFKEAEKIPTAIRERLLSVGCNKWWRSKWCSDVWKDMYTDQVVKR